MMTTDEKQKEYVTQMMTLLSEDVSPVVIMEAAERLLREVESENESGTGSSD